MRPSAKRRAIVRSARTTGRFYGPGRSCYFSTPWPLQGPPGPRGLHARSSSPSTRTHAQRCARANPKPQAQGLQPRPLPAEVRGVHVTMALAGISGKLEQYIAMKRSGLNAVELDVKDENGDVGFPVNVPLARSVGSAKSYYNAERAVAKIHAAGLYLIGRIVTFEDPLLSAGAPSLAIRRADGSRWLNNSG